ncbi:dihydrodipicolinate reductase [Mycobacterium seoulense]|uniref:dihydrodipicolinate reductase n=1 Tax=Mycobacterium seoulense TaxID=386911 RepID=UPI003CE8479F
MVVYRVIQCYTGQVGSRVIRNLIKDPAFEIVGTLVSSEAKHGRDIGELAGLDPIGLAATSDFDEILALQADCVIWNGIVSSYPTAPVASSEPGAAGSDAIVRLLRSGKNVYCGVGAWFTEGQPEKPELEAACAEGNVSIVGGGNMPGLVSDALPLFLSGYSGQVSSVWCKETDHETEHPSAHELELYVGFGLPVGESTPAEELINRLYEWAYRQAANQVASAMGVVLDDFRLVLKENAPAAEDIKLDNGLLIRKGTAAGVRFTFGGFVGGHQWYTLVCEFTCAYGLGPDWRQTEHDPQFTAVIEGTPSLRGTVTTLGSAHDVGPVLDMNAARAVNLVPLVAAAAPGCRNILELPFVTSTSATT